MKNLVERGANAVRDSGVNLGTMSFSVTADDIAREVISEMFDALMNPDDDALESAGIYAFRAAGTDEMRQFWRNMLTQAREDAGLGSGNPQPDA